MAKIYATTCADKSERERCNEQRSRKIAAQGMVLLQNNGILPLKETGKIALYGNGVRKTVKGGTGSGDVMSREVPSVEQAFTDAGFEIATKNWLDKFDEETLAQEKAAREAVEAVRDQGIAAVLQIALTQKPLITSAIEEEDFNPDCEMAVYVLSRNSGEGFDRKPETGDYYLHETEKENLRKLTEFYQHVIVVLNVGGVIDTTFMKNLSGIDAILLMSQGGCMGAHALVDVMTGRVTPSGHLTMTWAKKYEDYPNAANFGQQNGNLDDEYYSEGIYVGYRYFDTFGIEPSYPFGYGLSYTTFCTETKQVSIEGENVSVQVQVTNTGGQYSGREVVQVYYSAPAGTLEKPYQELAAYGKTKELAPGESEVLELSFPIAYMASYCEEKAAYIMEPGAYYVRVGAHSRATHVTAALQLEKNVVTEELRNCFADECEMELFSAKGVEPYTYAGEDEEKNAAPIIEIPAENIPCTRIEYRTDNPEIGSGKIEHKITMDEVRDGKYTLKELVAQLTIEELATLCVGNARGGWGAESVIGAASALCPGAAGDTTSMMIEDRNIRNMVLADGPAGLRLCTEFETDTEGNVTRNAIAASMPELAALFGIKKGEEVPKETVHYYQYATAIPIATLLAQTWDVEAVEEAGNIVGEEMKELGVTLWLAPGMNIHRNPLCGRNFEYYSEDPLVSGLCAAADTRGVQKYQGIGTTIKHFALNNQEDNRGHVNAHATERAIREIYLKGFEIAVKQAQPLSIMTSYNLVNGIHSANNYDLLTTVARDEWGFAGLVMTDWGTTGTDNEHKYGCSNAARCILAGNDLIMPGSQDDVDEIVHSVGAKEGEVSYPITKGDLQACALRIMNVLMNSAAYE